MVSPVCLQVSSSETVGDKKKITAEFEKIQSTFTNKLHEMKKSSIKLEGEGSGCSFTSKLSGLLIGNCICKGKEK